MSPSHRARSGLVWTAALLVVPASLHAQADMQPTNNLPNPYQTVEGWAKMPAGRAWGSTSAVDVDADGVSIWVAERCSTNQRGCLVNNTLDPVLKFDQNGNLVESFGAGLIVWPHGIHVDFQGNVWVVDGQDNRPQAPRGGGDPGPMPDRIYGQQVLKFSPTGELLMTLGQEGGVPVAQREGAAASESFFWQPNDVFVAPNGNIFVAEGHGTPTDLIYKFDPQGNLLMTWGGRGTDPGQFNQPHSLAMDSQGRLFVADRGNNRIQIFDQDGNFIDQWYQFSRLSGIYIDANDVLYGADSESGSVNAAHGAWLRGIRVGSARTGEITAFIPDPNPDCSGTCTAEGVVADRNGNIYGAEVGPSPGRLQRYVRR
ncbi:MAG: peptidyl-alpha-hydroxyglycine alpha-amidating lyase family protein [Gemmatimonadota bacterium]